MSGRRIDIERALVASDEPPVARHILLTMLIRADWETGVIPPEFTPSLTILQAETGLSRVTLATHLSGLESRGWLLRNRGLGRLNAYALRVPTSTGAVPLADPATSTGAELVQELNQPTSTGAEPALVQELNQFGQASFSFTTSNYPLSPTGRETAGAREAAKPAPKKRVGKLLTRLAEDWWPSDDLLLWAKRECEHLDDDDVARATRQFVNWAVGDEIEKKNWNTTWKNSMLRQDGYVAERSKPKPRKAQSNSTLRHRNPAKPDSYKSNWGAE